MSTANRNWTTTIGVGFYWIAMVMTLTCLAFVVAGNTELLYRFEHTGFPTSWVCGGLAVVAFLLAELCGPRIAPDEKEEASPEVTPEWEVVEV